MTPGSPTSGNLLKDSVFNIFVDNPSIVFLASLNNLSSGDIPILSLDILGVNPGAPSKTFLIYSLTLL